MRKAVIVFVAAVGLAAASLAAGSSGRSSVGPLDRYWLQSDTQGNIYEIAVGKLALQKGSGRACSVARMLIADHGKSLRENRAVGKQLHVPLPTKPNPLQQAIIQQLPAASASSFEDMFATFGVGDHQLDIQDAKTAVSEGQNREIRALARHDLPTLRKHLAAFISLAKSTSASSAGGTTTGGTMAATPTSGTTTTNATPTTPATTASPSSAGGC